MVKQGCMDYKNRLRLRKKKGVTSSSSKPTLNNNIKYRNKLKSSKLNTLSKSKENIIEHNLEAYEDRRYEITSKQIEIYGNNPNRY